MDPLKMDCRTCLTCLTGTSPLLLDWMGTCGQSQLLTLRLIPGSHSVPASLTVSFDYTPDFAGVRRIEAVLFNCPQWGISVQSISLDVNGSSAGSVHHPMTTSCDSLVKSVHLRSQYLYGSERIYAGSFPHQSH